MDCIFCKVANGQMATKFIDETTNVVVINDIHPKAPIHLLVIPKKHIIEFTDIFEGDESVWDEIIAMIRKIIREYGLKTKGYRIVTNGGGAQNIDHFHVHILGAIAPEV